MSARHQSPLLQLEQLGTQLSGRDAIVRIGGKVTEVAATYYRVEGLSRFVKLGDCVSLDDSPRRHGEIIRIDRAAATVKPFETTCEVGLGSLVYRAPGVRLAPCDSWKGRIINSLGDPIDGGGPLQSGLRQYPVDAEPPAALHRSRIKAPVKTGIRAIDIFTPICAGQRIGIFAGSGVGKSTLLGMLARSASFDVVVVALVGERGREVREFVEDSLGANRAIAVTVVATGDESSIMRQMAPRTAMAVAEYFRDQGKSVLLMIDSITRFAHASRDVALAAGEPAVARGYAPSIFTNLPKLLERAGPGARAGSITGIFSVLVDGDDHNDPVADAIRGTLDGHIVLDRAIADNGRYPAINVLSSISRLAHQIWKPDERDLVSKLRSMIAKYEETRDLRLMGGFQAGADPELDQAVAIVPVIYGAMNQLPNARSSVDPFRELAEALGSGK